MKKYLFYFACFSSILLSFISCNQNGASDEITIYGNVIDKTTGKPLFNVLIQEKNKVGGSTATGNDGNYEFKLPLNGSSDGKYYLVASKDKYSSSVYELEMSKVDKDRRVKVDFQLTSESIFYIGTVVDTQNKPIVDAKISATFYYSGGEDYNIGRTVITESDGSYALELPRPRKYADPNYALLDQWQYTITASKNGYAQTKHVLNQNADDMGKTITLNFILKSNDEQQKENQVTISGKVTDSNGVAMTDAFLMVTRGSSYTYVETVMTDMNGKYSISFEPQGNTYHFQIEKEGYNIEQKELFLSTSDKGKTFTLDFVLTKQ